LHVAGTTVSGKEAEMLSVTDALTLAQWSAQDAGSALMLLADYSLKRFETDAALAKNASQTLGVDAYGSTKLAAAIAALADQARHLHAWQTEKPYPHNIKTFGALAIDYKDGQAAARFLHILAWQSYLDFELGLISVADDAIQSTGWKLITGLPAVTAAPP
jgi:hypothetical protein